MEKSRSACQKDECRRHKVCDPARKKNAGSWATGGKTGINADMVNRHQQHYRATHNVN
jgi:hypothetical protein